jgi:hypothetical protein
MAGADEKIVRSVPHDKTFFLATESDFEDWRIFSHWY